MSTLEAVPGTVHDVRDFLEQARGYKLIRLSIGDILYRAYLVFGIGGFYAAVVLSGVVDPTSSAPSSELDGAALRGVMVGGSALALLAILRISTWAGPVMVGREDAAWLLPTPVDRRHLLRPHLIGGAMMGAMAGTVSGVAIMFVVLAVRPIAAIEALWSGAIGGMLLGLLGAVAGWFVEARPALARRLYRGSWVGWVAALGLGWLAAVMPSSIWLGPWGWVVAGFVDASAEPVAGWPFALLSAALLSAGVMWAADRNLAAAPDEELRRRAGLFSAVSTSLTFFSARTMADAYSTGVLRFRRIPRFRVPIPRQPWALPMWIDVVTLLRRRESVFRSQVAVLAAGVLVASSPKHIGVAAVASVLGYFAATPLVAQLRDTIDQPARAGPIPLAPAALLLSHLVVPAVVLISEMAVTVAILAAAGQLDLAGVPSALVVGTVASCSTLLVAAVAATRGAPPLHLMSSGEQGSMLIFAWFSLGPILSVMLVGVPVGAVAGDSTVFGGGGPTAVAVAAAAWFAAMELPILVAVLLSRGRKRMDPPAVARTES